MDTRDPDLFACPGGTAAPAHQTAAPPAVCTAQAPNADIANDQDIFTSAQGVPSK